MIITFCGHAQFPFKEEYEKRMLALLEQLIGDQRADLYLGGYGQFDELAYHCCNLYKTTHPKVSLILITPYMTVEYQQNHLQCVRKRYDEVLYPDLEKKPLKFAICHRNRWMVQNADYVICGIEHTWGGAYTTYQYAKRLQKSIYNIVENE